MAVVKYHRYVGELWQDLDLEGLVDALSDFFLQSGFGEDGGEWDESALQQLHDAILDALMQRGLLSDQDLQKLMAGNLDPTLAYMTGKLKVEGSMGVALKLTSMFSD